MIKVPFGVLIALLVLYVVSRIIGAKIKDIIGYLREGFPDEFTTGSGIICLVGFILFLVFAFNQEALLFVLLYISPEQDRMTILQNIEKSVWLFSVMAPSLLLGNILLLGLSKRDR